MDTIQATNIVKRYGYRMGFDVVRISSAEPFLEAKQTAIARLENGFMDGLNWYDEARVIRGSYPDKILKGVKSIISVAMSYKSADSPENGVASKLKGKVARYSWGKDYHRVIEKRLKQFVAGLSSELGKDIQSRVYVDTGPMQDRAVAYRSGVGWYGKNTNIITLTHGSWVFLGQVLTDLTLQPDQSLKKNCGSCTLCIDKCPTGAIVGPYILDNTKCISYLTIECRGRIPRELRSQIGDWVFGCDICQEVCPPNLKSASTNEPAFIPGEHGYKTLDLIPLLSITEQEFREKFQGTPIMRAKRQGLIRNVCVALGNIGDTEAIQSLSLALHDTDPIIVEHAAWALGQIGGNKARESLYNALTGEDRETIIEEIRMAIEMIDKSHTDHREILRDF